MISQKFLRLRNIEGDTIMRRGLVIMLIFAINLFLFTPPLLAYSTGTQPYNTISILRNSPVGFNQWSFEDIRHMEDLVNEYPKSPEKISAVVYREWQIISEQMRVTAQRERVIMPETGVTIFPSNTTGKLHVLSIAKKARENFLDLAMKGKINDIPVDSSTIVPTDKNIKSTSSDIPTSIYPDFFSGSSLKVNANVGSVNLSLASEDQYINSDDAIAAIKELDVPSETLKGYSIYLMPYTIEGLDGFAFSQGLPRVEECSFISAKRLGDTVTNIHTVIRHEIGHFIQNQYVGEYSLSNDNWQKYLSIGNKTYGEANWETDTTENFAEDFRVLYTKGIDNTPFRGSSGNPLNKNSTRDKLKSYFSEILKGKKACSVIFGEVFWELTDKSAVTLIPINGIADSENLVIGGADFRVRGTFTATSRTNPILLVQGENDYDKLTYFESPGTFNIKVSLPHTGKYQVILGEMNGNTIITHYLVNVINYNIPYRLNKQELLDYKLNNPVAKE